MLANYNTDEVIVIDPKNNDAIVETINVSAHPIDVKVDSLSNKVLVTSFASKKLTFISGDTNEITGTVDTGISPWGIGIDSAKSLAYIANHGSVYVDVVDIQNQKLVEKISIGLEGQSIAIDTNEHKIYVTFDDDDKILKINGNNNEIETVIELDGKIPSDIVADSSSHKLYSSIKFSDNILVMGPESYALSIPVVTQEPPILFVDNIVVHGQDVKPVNPILMNIADNIYNLTKFAFLNTENKSLTMQVTSPDGGNLQIKIPKTVLDSIAEPGQVALGNVTDIKFTVLIDGVKTEFKETPRKVIIGEGGQELQDTSREISVFIPKGDKKIEIIGKNIIS
jgi:DNA-binding beta-propeller fold protein YncE